MRILLWLIAIPLLLIVAAAILVPLFLDEDKLVAMAAETLEKETGAILTVDGGASLSIFPRIALALGDTSLTMPGDAGSSISLRSLDLGVQLKPLLAQEVKIDRLAVAGLTAVLTSAPEQPRVDTTEMSDAELDAYYAALREAREEAGAGAEAALAVPLALNVAELSITDSRIEQVDGETGERSVIELVKLESGDLNLDGQPIPLELELRLPGEGDDPATEVALDGQLRVDQATQQLAIDSMAVTVRGTTPQPILLGATGEVAMDTMVADLKLDIDLGEAKGNGTLRYAAFESPQIDADLKLNLFDPALLVLAGPEAAEAPEAETEDTPAASGDEPLPLDAIRTIDTRAKLAIEKAIFEGHEISNLLVKLRAVEGVIKLHTLTGELHGGKLDAKATFNGKHSEARLQTQGGLNDMDIAAALAAAGSEPVLSGKADLNWKVKSRGRTSNELIAALKGPIKLQAREAVLEGMAVEEMVCKAVALANRESLGGDFPDSSRFEALDMTLKLEDGKARLTPLRVELPAIKLAGEGRLHLLEQDFSAKFAARLSPELEELDPACRVNERLTAIDWPVDCEGSIAGDPAEWCGVDTEDILADLATNEAERKLKKEAGKLFDKFLNKDED